MEGEDTYEIGSGADWLARGALLAGTGWVKGLGTAVEGVDIGGLVTVAKGGASAVLFDPPRSLK